MIYVLLIVVVVQAVLFAFLAPRLRALERKEGARPNAHGSEPERQARKWIPPGWIPTRSAALAAGGAMILCLGTWAVAQNLEVEGTVTAGTVTAGPHAFNGNVDVNGVLKVTGGAPGAGRVLTSDAAGLASWQAVGVPSKTVIHYNGASCPSGWTELTSARGRYLVGLPSGGTLAETIGTALTASENRASGQHDHTITDPGHAHKVWLRQGFGGATSINYAAQNVAAAWVSPPVLEGPTITGITGYQVPTRWIGDGSSP